MIEGHWTRELPTVEGFYWYRESWAAPEVVLWEQDMQWVRLAGGDVPLGNDMPYKITGEFWSVPLSPPTNETP
jgi:hypothetical protein